MALPATEDFAGSGALSGNWTVQDGNPYRDAGEARGDDADHNAAYWNADAFNADQYSQGKAVVQVYSGVTVRASGTGGNWNAYAVLTGAGSSGIYEVTSGTHAQLQSLSTPSDGTVIRIEVSGTTIRAYYGGVQQGTDQTDGTISSGSAGFTCYTATPRIDDWEGGNLAAGSSSVSPSVSPSPSPSSGGFTIIGRTVLDYDF